MSQMNASPSKAVVVSDGQCPHPTSKVALTYAQIGRKRLTIDQLQENELCIQLFPRGFWKETRYLLLLASVYTGGFFCLLVLIPSILEQRFDAELGTAIAAISPLVYGPFLLALAYAVGKRHVTIDVGTELIRQTVVGVLPPSQLSWRLSDIRNVRKRFWGIELQMRERRHSGWLVYGSRNEQAQILEMVLRHLLVVRGGLEGAQPA
jgi:hypothetical protein